MTFSKNKPTEPGFYWCKPSHEGAMYYDCDETLPEMSGKPTVSIAQIICNKESACGTFLHVRFIGHKILYSLFSPVIQNTLWGERIIAPLRQLTRKNKS